MSKTSKQHTYTAGHVKQFVPLNGKTVNFSADVAVAGTSKFMMCIVTEQMKDTMIELPYREVDLQASATIRNDNDVYQPYFLVLKSDVPQELQVTIDLSPLQQSEVTPAPLENFDTKTAGADGTVWYKNWMYWAALIVLLGVIYFLFIHKNSPSSTR